MKKRDEEEQCGWWEGEINCKRVKEKGGEGSSAASGIDFSGSDGEKQETAATSPRASSDTHKHTHTPVRTHLHTHTADSAPDTHRHSHAHTHILRPFWLLPFNLVEAQAQISSDHPLKCSLSGFSYHQCSKISPEVDSVTLQKAAQSRNNEKYLCVFEYNSLQWYWSALRKKLWSYCSHSCYIMEARAAFWYVMSHDFSGGKKLQAFSV